MEDSWENMKQALEKLELDSHHETTAMDQTSGLNNPTSEAAVQEPHQPPGPVVKSATELRPVYFWANGRLQAQDQQEYYEVCRRRFKDVSVPYKVIRFFIRHPLDPTGSCSPSFQIFENTLLEEVFDWYLSETYEAPGPWMGEGFCLMRIDLAGRMLGKNYYYCETRSSGLRIHDTEWWDTMDFVITVVSSDRIMGNYKRRESKSIYD
ncbi:hypothetical protein Q9L58_001649 [Maublancomyces gigas]|uniref:Uncharacterized protein n=1 Tax=Discina gigas TaxID=1032678 RepID=A0ABR3GTR5_9PEZI